MKIQILDPEVKNYQDIEMKAIGALMELNTFGEIQWIKDLDKIKKFEVDTTPGLVINDKLKTYGEIPQKDEIKKWIREEN